MVCEWGMSDKLGPLHFGKREAEVFLGRDFNEGGRDFSEQTAIEIDSEVRRIVTENYGRAKRVIEQNLDKLKLLAEGLLEFETVDGNDIDKLFGGEKLERKPAVPLGQPKTPDRAKPTSSRPPLFSPPPGRLPDPEKA